MATDPFATALDGFRTWASAPRRPLAGDADADARELELLFGLMSGHLGISSPAELRRGQIEEMLLEVYPRKVVVNSSEDAEETVAALRDLIAYLDDTGGLEARRARQLRGELDEVEAEFADAIMNPGNWGPGRAIMDSMLSDGVDLDDQVAVGRWINEYNASLQVGGDEIAPGLKELFDLPDELPPMRLPSDAELAADARNAPMIARLTALTEWIGDDGRLVDEDEELPGEDVAAGAGALGVSPEEFGYLWEIAYAADWIDLEEDDEGELRMVRATIAEDWADGADDTILTCWDATLEGVLSETLLLPTADEASPEIDFEGHGVVLFIFLFLLRKAGLTRADAREIMREGVLGEEPEPGRARAWAEFTREHGDPADLLLERAAELGAVFLGAGDDGEVELSPLGTWAVRTQLIAHEVDIPLLPPVEEMSAVDLLSAAGGMDEEEFEAETGEWLAARDPLQAARELLSLASVGEPADRVLAAGIATRIGAPAEPAWRDVMAVPELTPYAKVALTALAGGVPGETQVPGLELSPPDMAWMTTDVLAILCTDDPEDPEEDYANELVAQLAATIPAGQEGEVFDLISRGPHPEAVEVLTMIGKHHPDKTVAKEARKCAYKAATRRANR